MHGMIGLAAYICVAAVKIRRRARKVNLSDENNNNNNNSNKQTFQNVQLTDYCHKGARGNYTGTVWNKAVFSYCL